MTETDPFSLESVPRPLAWLIAFVAKFNAMRKIYNDWHRLKSDRATSIDFLSFVLRRLAVSYRMNGKEKIAGIGKSGPLIVVANHPLGAVEGMVLARELSRLRPDLKVVVNNILLRVPEFSELFIGVDNMSARANNRSAIAQMHQHLQNKGALLIFPAGTVGHFNVLKRKVVDPSWHQTAAKLALKYDATCLTAYVAGRNSLAFYWAGFIHPRLRTLLLPRAMFSRSGRRLQFYFGQPFKLADVAITNARVASDYLRLVTELLPNSEATQNSTRAEKVKDIEAPRSLQYLQPYIAFEKGDFVVYCAPFSALGELYPHLASQREKTFRLAGEGSGMALDKDRFDPDYWHIIGWDKKHHALVGAYRACCVSEAISDKTRKLYSQSLFHIERKTLEELSQAIEVGRSFITPDYQKHPRALDLLWKGLGYFLLQNEHCNTFIGCVSISGQYAPAIRKLLHDSLLAGYAHPDFTRKHIRPRHKFRAVERFLSQTLTREIANVSALNKLFGICGVDFKVPVLIRQYLALQGRFVDFSVNTGFSDSLDGLVIVDLRNASERHLKRYLGEPGAEKFIKKWRLHDAA